MSSAGGCHRRRRASRHRRDLVHLVGAEPIDVADENGDALAVRTPRWAARLAFRRARQPARRCPFTSLDDPQVLVLRAIGIGVRALAAKRDLLAVGRPRRTRIVDLTTGQNRRGLARQIEYRDVVVGSLEIAVAILLEGVAVDHDRRRRSCASSRPSFRVRHPDRRRS